MPPDSEGQYRRVHLLADGQYTNGAVLKHLPPHTIFIGRIRKDAKLHYLPAGTTASQRGCRLLYGATVPTPEQVRTDEACGWETVSVFATGTRQECRVKTVPHLLWRTAGAQLLLKLVVIAPIHYRLRAGSVQQYLRRWE